ncbi:MAG: HAMP domain-containing protein [Planctomycetes bacterium]|nr:HAMP domain-containing protein [Planctomycetota bacterium]
MRLAAKLVAFLVATIAALLVVDGYFSYRRAEEVFRQDAIQDTTVLARSLANLNSRLGPRVEPSPLPDLALDAGSRTRIRGRDLTADPLPPDLASRLQRDGVVTITKTDGVTTYALASPKSAVVVEASLVPPPTMVRTTIIRFILLAGGALCLGAVVVVWLGIRWVGLPLRQLIAKTEEVGRGELMNEVRLHGRDELSTLAEALNRMSLQLGEARTRAENESEARLDALNELRHADRLKTVGRLASGIAHELGTPLNVLSGRATLIAQGGDTPPNAARNATIIIEQANRISGIVRQLLDFARTGPVSVRRRCDVGEIVVESIDLVRTITEAKSISVTWKPAGAPLFAEIDRAQIQQVIVNLLVNAAQAVRKGGRIEVGAEIREVRSPLSAESSTDEMIRIRVEDDGPGIPPDQIQHVFEPFFTTKDVGEGTGLGLSIAHGIVEDHGGFLTVDSEVGAGCRFALHLSRAGAEACPTGS